MNKFDQTDQFPKSQYSYPGFKNPEKNMKHNFLQQNIVMLDL